MAVAQEVSQKHRTADSAHAVVAQFFDSYRKHDVEAMTDLCSVNADFDYVPVEFWTKQRVQRAQGNVRSVGKVIWQGMLASFPDLSLTVYTINANDDGDVVAEVELEGTQARAWGYARSSGKHFSEAHLFIFHVDEAELIDSIRAYWNDASLSQQLGHEEID